jgi:hypothetical protein
VPGSNTTAASTPLETLFTLASPAKGNSPRPFTTNRTGCP